MRIGSILNTYITKNLLIALGLTIFITTFVGMLGVIGKLFRLVSGGSTSVNVIVMFVLLNMPKLMCYTLPIGLLVATVLTFNRMSADNEMTALRASGVSLLQIISPVVLLAIMISALAWWLQFDLAPRYTFQARYFAKDKAIENPVDLLEPDRPIAIFPGYYILIGGKNGKEIHDVHIYVEDKRTGELHQNITAKNGTISIDKAAQTMDITLFETTIVQIDPDKPKDPMRMESKDWKQTLNYGKTSNRKRVVRKPKEMTLKQLLAWTTILTGHGGKLAHYKIEDFMLELHKRAAWALSPFTFILIGVPLGLQIARRETSAGLVGSVVIAAAYYIPMVLISETSRMQQLRPELWMWGLNLSLQGMGIFLLWRRR